MDNKYNKISTYYKMEISTLIIICISGIIYNIGMVAGPWFEGQLAQKLFDIISGQQNFYDMLRLAAIYVMVILLVQFFRFIKRLYVRKFANHINREMKLVLYNNIIAQNRKALEKEGLGNVMTKAISDVDTCVEGIRKFTTEVFDTGVVMVAYIVMLLMYDWKLALISFIFPPLAYFIAEKLKTIVSKTAADYKESTAKLNTATIDRTGNAITYRVYGQEKNQNVIYEEYLKDYEKKAVRANIWENSLQPVYQMISMMSMIFIIWHGSANVLGTGSKAWNIASFTTFMACYVKLATKSSKAAKLFNAVQKARVSWKRVKPFMYPAKENNASNIEVSKMEVRSFGVKYEDYIFKDCNFSVMKGEFIGVTGMVACGKTTFGKAILGDVVYEGSILINDVQTECNKDEYYSFVCYMGHQPELINDTIENNILLGKNDDVWKYIRLVDMEEEVKSMPDGVDTVIGSGGIRLSGGQQARIALARTMCHQRPVVVLDDPFSAVDKATEERIMNNLKSYLKESIVFIISHRLTTFSNMDKVIWIGDMHVKCSTHTQMLADNVDYARLFSLQTGGDRNER